MARTAAVPSALQPRSQRKQGNTGTRPRPPARQPRPPGPLSSAPVAPAGWAWEDLSAGLGPAAPARLGAGREGRPAPGSTEGLVCSSAESTRGAGCVEAARSARSVGGAANINLLSCDTHRVVRAERENKRRPGIFFPAELKALWGLPEATGSGGLLQEDQLFRPAPPSPSDGALDVATSGRGQDP